ncbi:thioredoxin family protein [Halosimplex aquaticum]
MCGVSFGGTLACRNGAASVPPGEFVRETDTTGRAGELIGSPYRPRSVSRPARPVDIDSLTKPVQAVPGPDDRRQATRRGGRETRRNGVPRVRRRRQRQGFGGALGADRRPKRRPADALVDGNDVVLADFHAEWCGPCQAVEPVVEAIAAETDAAVAKIEVDANQPLAAGYNVRAIPTLVLFADGAVEDRFVGDEPPEVLVSAVERHL